MGDVFEYQFKLILKELDVLQSGIRSYDSILFKIKGWSITAFSAFTFFAVREEEPLFLGIATAVVALFWIFDATYKSFQRRYITRYNRLEHRIRQELPKAKEQGSFDKIVPVPDVLGNATLDDEEQWRLINPLKAALYPHTSSLYLTMILLLGSVFFFRLY
jgi:hypothetical protein